jgi:hypothetical protein
MTQQNLLQMFRALTDEERIAARDRARDVVVLAAGARPSRAAFDHASVSQYPAWFTRVVAFFMVVVFVAAAMPSLFRLYTAGSTYFMHGIQSEFLAAIVGISTFLLAEALIILSTISARVYFTGRQRLIFVVPVGMGLAMALVGNWFVAQPTDLFGWLETLVPPMAVLFLALIGERLILDAIETRHANERAYQEAYQQWQAVTASPESSPRFQSAYVNALRDELRRANSSGTGATSRKEAMLAFTFKHWSALVARELAADDWFTSPQDLGGEDFLSASPRLPDLAERAKQNGQHSLIGNTVHVQDAPEFGPMTANENESGYGPSDN